MNRETELAWAAGFFDGEGHVRSKNGGKTREIQISQKTTPCLERLRAAFEAGTIGGPYHIKNPVYFLYISRTFEVDRVLNAIWPYLSEVKRAQAIKAGFIVGKCFAPKVGRPPANKRTEPTCHPNRRHIAHGLCEKCYHAARYKRLNEQEN